MITRIKSLMSPFVICAGLLTLGLAFPLTMDTAQAQSADPKEFILELGDRAVGALTDKSLDQSVRRERFRDILNEGLDLNYVSQFVLGAYRRQASEEQLDSFKKLLEDNIVQNYAWRFRNYDGQELTFLGVRPASRDSQIVETELAQADDAPPIQVDWRVHPMDDSGFKIIDIIVEGISMMVTQRDEYVGFMRSNGGVDALLKALRKQNESLANRTEG
jgi:phospholipid transport system substrate-binding protein